MSKKVLIVDDDVDLIEIFKPVLKKNGFQVKTANNSQEGLEAFKTFLPDVALIDLAMEHFDSGFTLCHKIRKLPEGEKVPIYILTSLGQETGFRFSTDTAEEQNWIKADGYLEKPFSPNDLVEFLKEKLFK